MYNVWAPLCIHASSNQLEAVYTECQSIKMNEWTHFCHSFDWLAVFVSRKKGSQMLPSTNHLNCITSSPFDRNGIGNFLFTALLNPLHTNGTRKISNKYLSQHFLLLYLLIWSITISLWRLMTDLTLPIKKNIFGNRHEFRQKMTTNA